MTNGKGWPANRPAHGAAQRFIREVAVSYDRDDCLIWPFYRNNRGYACVRDGGRSMRSAARVVAELALGLPSDATFDTAHSCGNGHLGCVNPRHLRWATRTENMADTAAHGTKLNGARNPNAKLDERTAIEIRTMRGRAKQALVAAKFNISVPQVSAIQRGQRWGWLA